MIRSSKNADIESIINIWLEASIKAHDFMPPDYWVSKVNEMRDLYLPLSENYVYVEGGKIFGFMSVYQGSLAALFVSPSKQGEGIGSKLIGLIKDKFHDLSLSVYKNNTASISFYKKHGFIEIKEQKEKHTGYSEIVMKLNS